METMRTHSSVRKITSANKGEDRMNQTAVTLWPVGEDRSCFSKKGLAKIEKKKLSRVCFYFCQGMK